MQGSEEVMGVEQKTAGEEMEMLEAGEGGREVREEAGPWHPGVDLRLNPLKALLLELDTECSGRQGIPTSGAEVWAEVATLPATEKLHHSEYPRLLDDCIPEPPSVF